MPQVESGLVLFPRFTGLVGEDMDFTSLPVDVSKFSSAQLVLWRSAIVADGADAVAEMHLEESLDGEEWVSPTTTAVDPGADTVRLMNYAFRLNWFRIRIKMTGDTNCLMSCWAEGVLR